MSGLLKSDFYKLSKMKSFPICLLIVVALTVGSVFIQDYSAQFLGEGIVYNGSNQLLSTFAGDCKIFIAIVVRLLSLALEQSKIQPHGASAASASIFPSWLFPASSL